MDIIKSILHVFKKSDNAFKIMHPETESAQITDWNQGIVNTLASTALGGLVNTLTSDSLLATMIKKVLTAAGVKYNIAQNGYLCFGSLFGGLIIQWGSNVLNLNGATQEITLPININYAAAAVVTMRSGDFPGYVACPYWSECTKTSIKITPDYETGQGYAGTAQAIVTWILLSF